MVIGSQQSVGLYAARFLPVAAGTRAQPSRAAGAKAVGGRGIGETRLQAQKTEIPFPGQDTVETLRTGFGEGSVSVPTVAVRTLGKGLDGARQVVPTLEELQAEHRTRLAEQREAQNETRQKRETPAVDVQLSRSAQQAADQAQSFVNGLNETAKTAQARIKGESPPAQSPTATVRVNGQALDYIRAQTGAETQQSPTFNILV